MLPSRDALPAPRRAYLTLRSGTNVILDRVQNTLAPQIPLGDNDEALDPAYDVQVPTDGVPLKGLPSSA